VPGWSSLIIVTCLIGGAILVSIGVLGEYIGRIFEAVKERPLYVIASQIGRHEPASLATRSQADPVPSQLAAISHEN